MKRATLLALVLPGAALAQQSPEALIAAMDIDASWLVANSVSTNSSQIGGIVGQPNMYDVRASLGVISTYNAPTMALLSTGNVANIQSLEDYDYPQHTAFGSGSSDDRATLRFALNVPDDAQSYSFNFYFLSREYPEWVNSKWNDYFEVFVQNPAFSGQIVFDAFGNTVSVNNALFNVTNPAQLSGTGFDFDGGTGWVTTVAPVTPGSVLEIAFEIYDVSDGVWDSAVLLDNFSFSQNSTDGPKTGKDPGQTDPIEIAFLSPKEGPMDGGHEVRIYGSGFSGDAVLYVDGVTVPATPQSAGEILVVDAADWPAGAPGTVDVELRRDGESVVLQSAFTYWDESDGLLPPRVESVVPNEAQPGGGTELTLRVTGPLGETDLLRVVFVDAEGAEVVAAPENVEVLDGFSVVTVLSPAHEAGWADVYARTSLGSDSSPPFPFRFTSTAVDPGNGDNGGGRRTGCAVGATSGPSLLVLLFALALRRRREA